MSFLAQQFTTLSHIPVCLSRCQTKLGPGMTCCHWASFWGQTTHTYRIHTHWPQQRSLKRSDPTAVWVTACLSLLQIEQLALSVWFCTLTQKDNSSVCAREVITAFQCCFYPFHTQIQGYQHSRAAKPHKHTKSTKLLHTGSMGNSLTISRGMDRRGFS